ncbi:rhodanese-like domain-containing protein [Mariniflexile jejuense]|uniref:Rhodanese-like domain-containing protein n=1 Tax=Mariniflexile jejuense TaxID=1173582 RepID=A0ABW3JQB2_9FLAO
MKQLILLIYFFISISGFSCKETTVQNQVSVVTPTEANKVLQDKAIQIIDVRTPSEFAEGHIKNAKNIDFMASPSFTTNINTLDKEKPILVYCRSGKRSNESVKILLNAGFTKIYDLEGGILNWKTKSLPIVID